MNDLTVGPIIAGKRIATLQVEADSDVVINALKDAGEYIYSRRWQVFVDGVLVEWDDLSTDDQLKVLYQELIYMVKEMAGSYFVNAARTEAGETAEIEKETRYDL